MAKSLTSKLNKYIVAFEKNFIEDPFTSTYGLGRSLIAFSTLLVFVFNDISILFNEEALNVISNSELFINKVNFFGLFGFSNLIYAQIITIIILLSVISGYLPQITGLLHFWVCVSLNNSAILLDGGEQIASIFTFLIIPICVFDNRINHWSSTKEQHIISKFIAHIFFKIIALQAAYIYLNTAIEKLYRIPEWKEGTALYYVFNNPMFGLPNSIQDLLSFITNSKLIFILTWSIVLSHLFLSYALFLPRKKKKYFIFAGIFLHGCIAIFMGLYSFSFAMFGVLVLYLLPFNYYKKKIL